MVCSVVDPLAELGHLLPRRTQDNHREKSSRQVSLMLCVCVVVSTIFYIVFNYLRATAHAADPKDHVCIEYPFSNCQNVGPFDGDAM